MGGYATNPDTNATSEITGSGTANYMAKFTAAQVIGNSTVQDDGTTVSTTSLVNIGNASTAGGSLSQLRVGKGTSYVDIGERSAGTWAIWGNQSTPNTTNYCLDGNSTITNLNATGTINLLISNVTQMTVVTSALSFTPSVATSGAVVGFTFTGSANTGQTASTEINRFLLTTSSRQWATGAITTQREVYITSPTYSFVGASTITNAYTLYVEAPTAGTNATITNNYAAGFNAAIRVPGIVGSDTTNYTMTYKNTTGSQTSTGTCHSFMAGDNTVLLSLAYKTITFSPSSGGSGASSSIVYSPGSSTGQTASTEINGFLYNSYTRTWAAGAITTQREQYIKTVTYAFASASTITSAYGLYVEAPTAGTNATITNKYALGVSGGSAFIDGTTMRIGQASSQIGVSFTGALSLTEFALWGTGTNTILNTPQTLTLRVSNSTQVWINSTTFAFTSTGTVATGASTGFTFTAASNTGQTASTEINGFLYNSYTRTWAAGAITTQREQYIKTVTYAFASASTISEAYGMYIEAPTAGSNATITNNFALGLSAGTSTLKFGNLTGTTDNSAIYLGQTTPSSTNYFLRSDASGNYYINGGMSGGNLTIRLNDNTIMTANTTAINWTPLAVAAGSPLPFNITTPNSTGQTASTETIGFRINNGTIGHATGGITTQRDIYFTSRTHTFVGASTITSAYGLYVEAPTAGSNATITNNYALASAGAFQVVAGTIGNAGIVIRDWTASNTYGSIYMGVAPSTANYTVLSNGADSFFNGTTQAIIRTNNISRLVVTANSYSVTNTAFTFTPTTDVGQTASTEIPSLNYASGSRQWATGAITTQREVYFRTQTYTAVGASTITNAYGLYVEKPTASTNITITNNWSIGTDGKIQATGYDMNAYGYVMTKAGIGIISNQFSSNGGFSIASQTLALPVGILVGGTDGAEVARFSGQTTTGATNQIAFSGSSTTGQTNLTEITGVLFNSYSRAWAAGIGTITTQREYYVKTVTYTQATNALTITNAYGMYVEAPTASTNVTITNNWAIAAYGSLAILNNGILKLGNAATTGLVAGALAATTNASIVIYDSTGQAYRIPCII